MLFEARPRKQRRGQTALTQFESRRPLYLLTGSLRLTKVLWQKSALALAMRTERGTTQHLLGGLWCCALEAFRAGSPQGVTAAQPRVYRNFSAQTTYPIRCAGSADGLVVIPLGLGGAPLTLVAGSEIDNVALSCTGASVRRGLHLQVAGVCVGNDWYDFSRAC